MAVDYNPETYKKIIRDGEVRGSFVYRLRRFMENY